MNNPNNLGRSPLYEREGREGKKARARKMTLVLGLVFAVFVIAMAVEVYL